MRRADNLTSTCRTSRNQGLSISWNPQGSPNHLLFFHMRPANRLLMMDVALCHKQIGDLWCMTTNWRFYGQNFISPPCHIVLLILCSLACFLFPFLVVLLSISSFSSLFILFICVFSVCSFSYLFFFLLCSVSSFPSCSPFLYIFLVLRSFCPFPHPLSVSHSLSFS